MMAVKVINVLLILLFLLLLRKLLWCLRWLWCYYHGQEVPDPIPFLPQRSGRGFEAHLGKNEDDREE